MSNFKNRIGQVWKLGSRIELIVQCNLTKFSDSATAGCYWKTLILVCPQIEEQSIGKFNTVTETGLLIAESEKPEWHQIYSDWYRIS